MNYRHAFHAGNFADVHKHYVLVEILRYLLRKPQPLLYLDTHAGAGLYDFGSSEALRGNEWQEGIGRLLQSASIPLTLNPYLEIVKRAGALRETTIEHYPGSPLVALALLRPEDRIVLVEANELEAAKLSATLGRRRNLSILRQDGYAAINAQVPPREKRGLVFIDPPYESPDEFEHLAQGLIEGLRKWPTGLFCAWYPLKHGAPTTHFHKQLIQSGLRRLLIAEINIHAADSRLGLNGSGVVIANPPWQLDEAMKETLPQLHTVLSPTGSGGIKVEWLVGE